jgi:hypothetical protein
MADVAQPHVAQRAVDSQAQLVDCAHRMLPLSCSYQLVAYSTSPIPVVFEKSLLSSSDMPTASRRKERFTPRKDAVDNTAVGDT